jgi:hypothetical protein
LRFFADTFLTTANIEVLLGADAPELKKLKEEWYCFKILGCMQDNSQFPIMLHVKIEKFCEDQPLDDGMLQTMTKSMTNIPVKLNDFQETPGQRVSDRRKSMTKDFSCRKTNGCEFVSKNKTTLTDHEKKCCPKPRNLVCKTQGCKFVTLFKAALTSHVRACKGTEVVTLHKAALTNHVKACRGTEVVSTQEKVASPKAHTPQVVKVYACPHGSCKMTHPTKKENKEHQLTHQSNTTSPPKSTPPSTARSKGASKNPPVLTVDDLEPNAERSDQEQESESDDAKKRTGTNKRNRGSSSKPQKNKETEISKPTLVTKEFKCPFVDCDKSHATAELAQYHQRKHQSFHHRRRPTGEVETLTLCPECKLYSGTDKQVLAHIAPCRAALTCPQCSVKCDSQPHLIAHIFQCSQLVDGRKRQREDTETCRAALTCPQCSVKCDSQPHLIDHIFRCSQFVDGRKRQREETETFDNEKRWKPDRNRNDKNDVKLYWKLIHVQEWLKLVELEEYQGCFAKEKVDGRILLALTEDVISSPVYEMKPAHAKKFIELRMAFY